jgi:hypothetical protein
MRFYVLPLEENNLLKEFFGQHHTSRLIAHLKLDARTFLIGFLTLTVVEIVQHLHMYA